MFVIGCCCLWCCCRTKSENAMFVIGCHLSVSKGYLAMGKEASSLGANTFQFFPRNPRGGAAKAEVREFARTAMREDLAKAAALPRCLYNLHPGSHVRQGTEAAIPLIADMLNEAMDQEPLPPFVLLETMAGKGTEVGRTFEELAEIIELAERKDRVGVCLDTCHVYDAGYDIVNDLDGVLTEFDRVIGLDRLRAVHLNDDKNPLGSRKDRHEKIGEGTIGLEAMGRIINHPALRELPFFLETPNELPGYAREIALLRSLRPQNKLKQHTRCPRQKNKRH